MTSPNPVLPVLPASSMTSTDFAEQAIGALIGSAGEQAANFLGGLLINSLLQGLGFSSQSEELSEILSLEQQILKELTQLSSEIELQTVDLEEFTDTWNLIPFLDDDGIVATAVVTGIGQLIGGDVYMLGVNTTKQTSELSLTSSYSSDNNLWHFQTIPA